MNKRRFSLNHETPSETIHCQPSNLQFNFIKQSNLSSGYYSGNSLHDEHIITNLEDHHSTMKYDKSNLIKEASIFNSDTNSLMQGKFVL